MCREAGEASTGSSARPAKTSAECKPLKGSGSRWHSAEEGGPMLRRYLKIGPILALAVSAQQFPSSSLRVTDGQVTAIYGPPRAVPVVTQAPYSADQWQEYAAPGDATPSRGG